MPQEDALASLRAACDERERLGLSTQQLSDSREEVERSLAQVQAEVSRLREALGTSEHAREQREAELASKDRELSRLSRALEGARRDAEDASARGAYLSRDLDSARDSARSMVDAQEGALREAMTARGEVASMRQQLQEVQAENAALSERVSAARQRQAELESIIAEAREREAAASSDVTRLRALNETLRGELSENRRIAAYASAPGGGAEYSRATGFATAAGHASRSSSSTGGGGERGEEPSSPSGGDGGVEGQSESLQRLESVLKENDELRERIQGLRRRADQDEVSAPPTPPLRRARQVPDRWRPLLRPWTRSGGASAKSSCGTRRSWRRRTSSWRS